MNKKVYRIFIILILIACNIFLVARAYNISKVYPFSRIILGNRLHYSSVLFDRSPLFNAKIKKINNIKVNSTHVIFDILKFGEKIEEIELSNQHGESIVFYPTKRFNFSIFSLLIFLILFANIHTLWGFIVRVIHPHYYSARLYSNSSISIGLLFFSAVSYLMLHGYPIYLFAAIMLISYLFVNVGIEISFIKDKKKYNKIASIVMLVVFLLMIAFLHLLSLKKMMLVMHLIIGGSAFVFISMFVARLLKSKKKLLRAGTILIIIFLTGIIIPYIFSIFAVYYDLYLPINLFSSITLVFPMIIGNNFINENILNSYTLKRRYFTRFVIDCVISSIAAYSFYFVANLQIIFSEKIIYYITCAICFLILLALRNSVISYLRKSVIDSREVYMSALKKIAEITVSQNSIVERMNFIQNIIYELINTNFIKLALFESQVEEIVKELEDEIDYLDDDNPVVKFYNKNRNIIKKDSLLSGWRYEKIQADKLFGGHVEIIIPIELKKIIVGVLIVGEKHSGKPFNQNEVQFINSASLIMYHMIENEILFQNYIVKRKYEKELDIASYIQMRLFPKYIPFNKGVNISYYSRPYIKVTGDYFDFVELDEDRTAFIISDVSGHGMPAAMILSIVGSVSIGLLREGKSIDEIVEEINDFMTRRYSGIELITFFISVFNKKNLEFQYVNAGHCFPIIISKDRDHYYELEDRNHILGVDDNTDYQISTHTLKKGDEIILYTDGLTELFDISHGGDIGSKILNDVIEKYKNRGIEEKIDGFRDYIDQIGSDAIKDDITIVGIEIE